MAFNKTANLGINIRLYNRARGGLQWVAGKLNQIRLNAQSAGKAYRQNFFQLGVAYGVLQNGLKVLSGLQASIKEYREFEKSIAEVSTLVDTSKVSMDEYTQSIKSMSAAYGDLPTATAKGFYQTISAGFTSVAESTKVMDTAMKLSVGGITDTKTAVDGLTTILNSWNLSADESKNVSDALFVAMREGKTTVGELSRFFGTASNFAAKAGVKYHEVAAAVAALTTGGVQTPLAFRGLRAVLAAVARGAKRSVKAAEDLGISFDMASIKAMGFQNWLKHVYERTGGNERALSKLFGRVNGLAAIFTLGSTRAAKFDKVLGDMQHRAGATDVAFGKMANTMDFQLKKLSASWSLMKIAIGKAISVAFLPVVKFLSTIVDGIREFADQHPHMTRVLGTILAIGGAIVVVTAATKIFGIVWKTTWMEVSVTAAKAGVAMLTNPIVLVLAAIVAGLYAIKKAYDANLGGFADAFDKVLGPIKDVTAALWEMATTGEVTGKKVRRLFNIPGAIELVQMIAWVRTAFVNFFDGIVEGFQEVGKVFDPVVKAFEGISAMIQRLAAHWRQMWGYADSPQSKNAVYIMLTLKALGMTIGMILGMIVKGFAAAVGVAVSVLGFFIETVAVVLNSIIQIFTGVIQLFTGKWDAALENLAAGVTGFFLGIGKAILGFIHSIVSTVLSVFGVQIASFKEMYDAVISYVATFIGIVVDFFTFAWDIIMGVAKGIISAFKAIGAGISKVFKGIGKVVSTVFGGIKSGINALKSAFNGFVGFLKAIGSAIAAPFKPLIDSIKWLVRKIKWLIDRGKDVVNIAKKINPFSGGGIAGTAMNKIRDKFDIVDGKLVPKKEAVKPAEGFKPKKPGEMGPVASAAVGREVQREGKVEVNTKHLIKSDIYLDGAKVAKSVETHLKSSKESNLKGTSPVVNTA